MLTEDLNHNVAELKAGHADCRRRGVPFRTWNDGDRPGELYLLGDDGPDGLVAQLDLQLVGTTVLDDNNRQATAKVVRDGVFLILWRLPS
jgi:hypothetical protein